MNELERAMLEEGRRPTIIVDDLHVKYRTFASGKPAAGSEGGLISRGHKGLREVHALKGITFTAFEGESVGVIGSNGSGKSTLLRTIAGLTPATSGVVYAEARPALLGVNAALLNELSGDKNVRLGGLALGFTPQEIRERFDGIVKFAELEEFIDLPMRTYSAGMSARLRFAIAASKDHALLLVDEALAVGDRGFRQKSEERIREMRASAGTVMHVSHSIKSILDSCTRVIWIEKGVLRMNGDPREVTDAYQENSRG
ncbi:MAG: teichoic acid transporter ATP-binding protein [Naasia sp.]|uniref:ABC transporter ATP-binding protein n=1 Tax=Naasia sp. TaxID=2546198 RepID=UPI00263628C9|nr:ABC transporter ATP-binding protein [Naasia sp.]MCU1569970.1 teichoic acid transporter ATP-binding protein [Naasia sp.]